MNKKRIAVSIILSPVVIPFILSIGLILLAMLAFFLVVSVLRYVIVGEWDFNKVVNRLIQ